MLKKINNNKTEALIYTHNIIGCMHIASATIDLYVIYECHMICPYLSYSSMRQMTIRW